MLWCVLTCTLPTNCLLNVKKYKVIAFKILLLYLFRVHILEQWAKIVVVLERGFSRNQLLEFQKMYAIKMMGPPKENLAEITEQVEEQRGLMVIKTSSKTKARQRKGAISNWKVRELARKLFVLKVI